MDITTALPDLKKMGIKEARKMFWIGIEAVDPDDACAEAYSRVYHMITGKKSDTKFKEAAEIVRAKMRVLKIKQV